MNIHEMPDNELHALLARISSEIKTRRPRPRRITKSFGCYNEKRFSKPWLARVIDWPVGRPPELRFGHYLGTSAGGESEILAQDGDVVRWGQKDNRGNHTVARWGIVESNGCIRECTEAEARRTFGEMA